ncbi:leucine-rich repeat protein [Butyrivibrio sp. YAB3001]|uniref:leucine-rich repeat protein n=1 Tax=Butyrivibrio sp. YAB3001 TaxID=1520812 RepID=UPI0008F64362|nr:leucine-rich repeat protein [Butyrivibrio sp. YAB3001]SFC60915.1 Transglutaminase-like superfamily protein [Butyrivibrio sp. YAB3001]
MEKKIKSFFLTSVLFILMALVLKVPSYAASPAQTVKYETEVKKILSGMNSKWKDEEKLFYIHDYIVTHAKYDHSLKGWSAYDCIVNHNCVCNGYALAFEDVVKRTGIPVTYISSVVNDHAWNAVKLNGKWYYVDCTWDDNCGDDNAYSKACHHEDFLVSEKGMRKTGHIGKDWLRRDLDAKNYGKYTKVCGKYTDTKYDSMKWHETSKPVALLSNGISYASDYETTVYLYGCNGGKETPIFKVLGSYCKKTKIEDGWVIDHSDTPPASVTGSGNKVFISVGDYVYYYNKNAMTTKTVYKLSSEEKLSGVITDVSLSGSNVRYDIGELNIWGDAQASTRAEYVAVNTITKNSVPSGQVDITDNGVKHMSIGSTLALSYKTSGVKTLKWTSDNVAVAEVSAKGVVKAKKAGTCRITLSGGGAKDSFVIVVDSSKEEAASKPKKVSGKPDSEWLKNFGYYYVDEGYLFVMDYKGKDTTYKVPATAIYSNKQYKIAVGSNLITCNSKIQNISFEKGVTIFPGDDLAYLNDTIKSIDLRGCVVKKNEYGRLAVASDCSKLETINMKGLDVTGCNTWRASAGCEKLTTIVMPKYYGQTYTFWMDSSIEWRVYENEEYGNVTYKELSDAPANATLKKYVGPKKKGTKFTQSNITYKVVAGTTPSVTVTKITGKTATIPSTVVYKGVRYLVSSISANAAKDNAKLTSVTIGSCVTSIGENAFNNCKKLTTINVKSGLIKKVKGNAFTGVSKKAVVTVPADCKTTYTKLWQKAGFPKDGKIK